MHSYFQQLSAIFLESQQLSGILILEWDSLGTPVLQVAWIRTLLCHRRSFSSEKRTRKGQGGGICASYPVHVGEKKKDGYVLLIRSMYSSWSNRIGWLDSSHPNQVEVWVLDFHLPRPGGGAPPSFQHGHERSGERNSRASAAWKRLMRCAPSLSDAAVYMWRPLSG